VRPTPEGEADRATDVAGTVGRNLELFEEAARDREHVFDFDVVGRRVRVRLAGAALDRVLIDAVRHRELASDGSEPELTICAWDRRSTGAGADLDGVPVVGDEEDTRTLVRGQAGFLALQGKVPWAAQGYDAARRTAFLWAGEPSVLSRWGEQTKPFLEILHAWLIDSPWQPVHGGAVGGADGGVLLAGGSGAGKSTTVMSCVRAGWLYAGDDYLAIRTDGAEALVDNLYASARLRVDMAERFAEFRSAEVGAVFVNGIEKRDMMLDVVLPRSRFSGFPIRAILLPKITSAPRSKLHPASAAQATVAIGSTTMHFLRVGAGSAFEKIGGVAAVTPAYWVELGDDIDDLPALIKSETGIGPG
jgi:hypothetical protein